MKYLITLCITAIAIAFLVCSSWYAIAEIHAEAKMRVLTFREYARAQQQHGKKIDPKVEIPTAKDLQKEKL
jgi:hypothetical protein